MAQKLNQKQFGVKYSTDEQLTGDVWIDGKPIYRKTIYTGQLPNNAQTLTEHNISNIDKVVKIYGLAWNSTPTFLTLPYPHSTAGSSMATFADTTKITIGSGSDRTPYTNSYVTLEYTKV